MNIFRKFFGRKNGTNPPSQDVHDLSSAQILPTPTPRLAVVASAPPTDPAKDPNMIRVYDHYGREMFITRQEWRDNVLPGTIEKAWSKPDELYAVVVGALQDGFRANVVKAAEQLYRTDPVPSRGACVWGIVLMEEGRLNEAEKLLQNFLVAQGEDGSILTNLAKVYTKQGDARKSEQTLWHALEIDPNQANGMSWFEAIHRERGGEAAGQEALRRVAALPGSWRAQLWLARSAVASAQLTQALTYYQESLSHAGEPVPTDLLMQMSGDLGNRGHLAELLRLTAPRFNAAMHGLQVGNNLIKAHVDLGQLDEAKRLVETLYGQNRPDWRETLQFWETEIAKKGLPASPLSAADSPQMTMLTVEGPIWLRNDSPAAMLIRAQTGELPWVSFMGGSADVEVPPDSIQHQMTDTPGRLSRALPLFLAEQTDLYTQSRAKTLVPWMVAPRAGFVLFGKPYGDEDAAHIAREGSEPADWLVLTHLVTIGSHWKVQMRLVRTIDGTCLANWQQTFHRDQPEEGFGSLVSLLHAGLREHVGILPRPSASAYTVPQGAWFTDYMLRLEQLLAVRCAAMDRVSPEFLHGEREILDGSLAQCLKYPQSLTVRLLLMQTAAAMKKVRPDIVRAYADKLAKLHRDNPLPGRAQSVLQDMIDDVLEG